MILNELPHLTTLRRFSASFTISRSRLLLLRLISFSLGPQDGSKSDALLRGAGCRPGARKRRREPRGGRRMRRREKGGPGREGDPRALCRWRSWSVSPSEGLGYCLGANPPDASGILHKSVRKAASSFPSGNGGSTGCELPSLDAGRAGVERPWSRSGGCRLPKGPGTRAAYPPLGDRCCQHQLPQIYWLKTMQLHCLTVQ